MITTASCLRRWAFVAALVLIGGISCSNPRMRSAGSETPPVVTARGELLERLSIALIERAVGRDPAEYALVQAFLEQTETPLVAGNHAELLIDGPQTFAAMRRAITQAQHHIHVETYIFAADELGASFAQQLIGRRREGIEVRVLYDAIGSLTTPNSFFDEMRKEGIEVLAFKPLNPVNVLPWRANNRDHRKIVVVDGAVTFTGGINISSTYSSASSSRPGPEEGIEEGWRDTHVEIRGPVVSQFQTLFLQSWTRAGGKFGPEAPRYFPPARTVGDDLIASVTSDGADTSETTVYATYLAAIRNAHERIWLTHAYFAPNKALKRALVAAVKRGVDVRLIVPSFTDSGLILNASRASYDELLAGGVRIYEQTHALLHAKTAVFDDTLSIVGSANLDMRSFVHNNEVNAVVIGRAFADRLKSVFERDLKETREITRAVWRQRSMLDRIKQVTSSWFTYWL